MKYLNYFPEFFLLNEEDDYYMREYQWYQIINEEMPNRLLRKAQEQADIIKIFVGGDIQLRYNEKIIMQILNIIGQKH